MTFLSRLQPFGLLVLRFALGIIFFTHGYPKLMHPTAEMQRYFVQHGLPAQSIYVAGALEAFGGILLCFGLFSRFAALLLAIEVALELWKVYGSGSIYAVHVYEFPLLLAAASLALATIGPGILSIDEALLGSRPRKSRSVKKSKD